jgi:DNA-directed RNA polymerase specialized sigma24 family protein
MNDASRTDVVELFGRSRRYARSLARDESQAEDWVQGTPVCACTALRGFEAIDLDGLPINKVLAGQVENREAA